MKGPARRANIVNTAGEPTATDITPRDRHDWAQADLRCLLCGRILGTLVGPLPEDARGTRPTAWSVRHFAIFQSADVDTSPVRLNGREQFRCSSCGGGGVLDSVEVLTTYDSVEIDDVEERPRRGRPPKPWRRFVDARAIALGLTG